MRRIELAASTRWVGLLVIALAMGVAATSLGGGFVTDDHAYRVALRDHTRPSYDLFRFASGDPDETIARIETGALPWWTPPAFKLHLIRPLTSLVFALDASLFGSHPLGYRLDSMVWLAAMLVAVWLLFRRLLPGPAGLAAQLVFSLRTASVLPYAWLSARHVLVAAVPAFFALLAHVRARSDGWRPGRWLAPLLFVVALGGSEAALAIAPFWITFALVEARRSGDAKRAIRGALPVVVLALLYLVAYPAIGGGARATATYRDVGAPLELLRVALTRLPLSLADVLLGVPIGELKDAGALAIVTLGAAGVVLCVTLWFAGGASGSERAPLAWLVPGALAGLAVGLAGPPWGHVLVIPGMGFSALLGVLLARAASAATSVSAPRKQSAVIAGSALAFMHVVVAPLASIRAIRWLEAEGRLAERAARTADLGDESPKRVFVLSSARPEVFLYARDVLADESPGRVACWSALSPVAGEHRFTRTGERSFTLEVVGRPESQAYTWLYYSPLTVGSEASQCGATIRVDALGAEGYPSRLHVELDEPLERPGVVFLAWKDGRLAHFRPPSVPLAAESPWPSPARVDVDDGRMGVLDGAKRAVLRALGH